MHRYPDMISTGGGVKFVELGGHCLFWIICKQFACMHCWETRAVCTDPMHLAESAALSGSSRLQSSINFGTHEFISLNLRPPDSPELRSIDYKILGLLQYWAYQKSAGRRRFDEVYDSNLYYYKFGTAESAGEWILKIGQYLAKLNGQSLLATLRSYDLPRSSTSSKVSTHPLHSKNQGVRQGYILSPLPFTVLSAVAVVRVFETRREDSKRFRIEVGAWW